MRAKIQRGADYERLDSDLRRQKEVGNMGVPLGDGGEEEQRVARGGIAAGKLTCARSAPLS